MLITGARIAVNAQTASEFDVWLDDGLISFFPPSRRNGPVFDLKGFMLVPGLINAHDHLELNLFPRLGQGPYPNANAWALDIYRPGESPIKQHLAVPKSIRLKWGAIKNLISGVTTVAHHNALHPSMVDEGFPVRIVKRFGWAHSLHFSPDWKHRFHTKPTDSPFVIHAAEGCDETAAEEIDILNEGGALNSSTVIVHGVAVSPTALSLLLERSASLVWCPTSNYFTLGRTVSSNVLNSNIPIALGSDSALTGKGDLLDELRFARTAVGARRLYEMVTSIPARMFRLPAGFGEILHGGPADLVVMRDSGQSPAETLLSTYPELVILKGKIVVASEAFASRVSASLQRFAMEGRGHYFIAEQLETLFHQTASALGKDPRLAGKAIAA